MLALGNQDLKKKAVKLHKQFGHPTAINLIKMLRSAEIYNREFEQVIDNVSEKCEVCVKYKKPKSRPIVSMPMASSFNETIAMDLKVWKKMYFIVFIDLATRFCTAAVIKDKNSETIIKSFFKNWICFFGAPNKILSDNGCEFSNSNMRMLGEAFNIKVLNTAAESPWSNGVCERLNSVLGNMVSKIIVDTGCDVEIALSWAVSARNSLLNNSGYSPNQLVFGVNPSIPNVFNSQPPALEEFTMSDVVRKNLDAMHSARKEFLRYESDEKIKRALRYNIRSTLVEDLENGDEVYYKRNDSNEWHGPGIVIGRDGKQVLVRHGGIYVRVHTCRLVKTPIRDSIAVDNGKAEIETRERKSKDYDCWKIPSLEESVNIEDSNGEIMESDVEEPQSNVVTSEEPATAVLNQPLLHQSKITIGQRIQGIDSRTGEFISAKIISRAGKATGRYKHCYNVKQDSDGSVQWVDLSRVNDLKLIDEHEESEVLFNNDEIMEAKYNEIESWKKNGVFEEVEDLGQQLISTRWIITEKQKEGITFIKARLVARGFEEDTNHLRKDSPTCSREAIRIALALVSSKNWICHTVDVKAAYLQGENINRDIFLKPPPEFDSGSIWHLKKTVYGLCDAARAWYLKVKDELLSLNARISSLEPSLFSYYHGNNLAGIICIYVDDFLWAGTKHFEEMVIKKLHTTFLIGGNASASFKYIGINVISSSDGVSVDQYHYAECLRKLQLSKKRLAERNSELSTEERRGYRSLIGQLNWISTTSRPDIAFETGELSILYKNAGMEELKRLNKLVDRVKCEPEKLFFPKLSKLENCYLDCYSDASFANICDGSSQGGFIIFLRDLEGKRCPVLWQSRKIRRIVKSTLSAEAMALLDCAEAAVYIANILYELSLFKLKIVCHIDNKSLYDALHSSKHVEDRRLRIDIAVLRDMIDRGELSQIVWVETAQQLADCLTKRGASTIQLRAAVSGH